jgi:guanine deaminase
LIAFLKRFLYLWLQKELFIFCGMTHWDFIEEAIYLSEVGIEFGDGPFGCVIVKNHKIIGRGFNLVSKNADPTAHAEIVAIRDACKALNSSDLSDCIIYTSCQPCPMCLAAIYWAGIRKVFYANTAQDAAKIGFDDSPIYSELDLSSQHHQLSMEKIGGERASKAFTQWSLISNNSQSGNPIIA